MTDSQVEKSWSTKNGVIVRAVQRPDGAWLLRLPEEQIEEWSALLEIASKDIGSTMLVTRPADEDERAKFELHRAGFLPGRQETVWRLPVAELLTKPKAVTDHHLVSVNSLDAGAVADLDNRIRRDIPGTEEWIGTGADLIASLDDPEFDPELYRVARHIVTGSLDGLIRVWNRTPEPRLGCIGVTQQWRRTRLALYLVQDIATTLHARGVTHVTAETDTTNRDSHVMARRQGGEATRATIEWKKVVSQ